MYKKISSLLLALILCTTVFAGCGDTKSDTKSSDNVVNTTIQTAITTNSAPVTTEKISEEITVKKPKYIFAFIGDGMSHVQINAAKVYRGNNTSGEVNPGSLNFTIFPVAGIATTHDSTSFCPDSASTATSIATGVKTHSGVIGMEVDKTTVAENISEKLSAQKNMKIGIISSVTINHATPAAFYSHVASRNEYYDIAMQMANSNFDYFAGGTISSNTGKDGTEKDVFDVLTENGYTIADTVDEINALNSNSGKVYAVSPVLQDSGAMPYTLDSDESTVTLADFVDKGIEVLDNENGFFLMCESGKIDWACHANDAMSAITDVLGFESAIQSAVDFANLHPDETLIIVTGDHETGGMTIGYAATGYDTAFSLLGEQKMSYVAFDEKISEMKTENPNLKLEEVMPLIKENFGLMLSTDLDAEDEKNAAFILSESEYQKLKDGFSESMKSGEDRTNDETTALLYGGYDPLSVSLTHIINNKAGIGWTSYAHTGTPVPVYAMGASSELFSGSYDNTDIHDKLLEAVGL